ncbi:YihY/virulence factor BrkB family protein [Catellicoccus marimammalium]|uniref:Ribonuclease BN n=1 Tax=Catellicoccus marimammalium M35/04/3 TaxID=1234409 RepID=K8ZCC0_9ENTE|nr:YihY/virulence factor BrkB family protein [Catellicoccus marimammalium]EKU27682.1 Ribonuclease BN [Catellicoccus marimammalium M35/04/3]
MKKEWLRWKEKGEQWIEQHPKWLQFFLVVRQRIKDAEVGNSSCVVAYYFLLSMFPLIIMLGSAISFMHLDPTEILPYIQELFPGSIYHLLENTIVRLLTVQNKGGIFTVAAIVTFWAASKSVNGLQRAMNKAYGVEERKNFIISRLFSFVFIVFLFFVVLFLIAIFSLGTQLLDYVHQYIHFDERIIYWFTTIKWPVTIVMMFLIMIVVYRLVPNARITFHQVWRGALFSTIGWVILAQLFGRFAHHLLAKYSSYGVIGTMMVIILWLKLAAIVIVFGGIINAVSTEIKYKTITEGNDSLDHLLKQWKQRNKQNRQKKEEAH